MTKEQIESIFERVRSWPPERQEEAASILLALENDDLDDCSDMTEEDWADLDEALAEMDRGEFASEEEMKELYDLLKTG